MRVNKAEARFGFISSEGLIAARFITEGIMRVRGPLTKETLITSLKSIKKSRLRRIAARLVKQ